MKVSTVARLGLTRIAIVEDEAGGREGRATRRCWGSLEPASGQTNQRPGPDDAGRQHVVRPSSEGR